MVETFIGATNNDLDAEIKKLEWLKYSNLSGKEQKALEKRKEKDIVITNTDKGGAVATLDVKDYAKECQRQLNNTENYKHLQKDRSATKDELVYNIIKRFEKEELSRKSSQKNFKWALCKLPNFILNLRYTKT